MIINGSAYGLDSTYSAIRLADSLSKRSTMEALTDHTIASDKVLVF